MATLSLSFLAQLASFKLRVKTLAEGVLSGLHPSARQGQSVEFAEHKEYAPGDELRHLDWKVLGKMDRYFIKRFQHEAHLPFVLLVDTSGSMGYPEAEGEAPQGEEGTCNKLEAAKLLAGAFAWVASKQQDAVGLLAASSTHPRLLRPKAHANHLGLVLSQLETLKADGENHLVAALESLSAQLRRRLALVVFSDLLDSSPLFLQNLLKLRKQKHDVALFHVLHADEVLFPFEENALFLSMEDNSRLEAHPLRLRHSYLKLMRAFLQETQAQCRAADVDYALVQSQGPLEEALVSFFMQRKRGRRP